MSDHYELLMPFVVCESNGGPFDDTAYVAGYEAGRLDAILASPALLLHRQVTTTVRTENVPQVDLIAMRHGWVLTTEYLADGWTTAVLTR